MARTLDQWSHDELDARARLDAHRLTVLSRNAGRLAADLDGHPELWTRDGCSMLPPDERRAALTLFDRVLDLQIAFDAISTLHHDFWRIGPVDDAARHARHFALHCAAYFGRLA